MSSFGITGARYDPNYDPILEQRREAGRREIEQDWQEHEKSVTGRHWFMGPLARMFMPKRPETQAQLAAGEERQGGSTTAFVQPGMEPNKHSPEPAPPLPPAPTRSQQLDAAARAVGLDLNTVAPPRPAPQRRQIEGDGAPIQFSFGGGALQDYVPGQTDVQAAPGARADPRARGVRGAFSHQARANTHLQDPRAILRTKRLRRAIEDESMAPGELGARGFTRGQGRDLYMQEARSGYGARTERLRQQGAQAGEQRRGRAYATADARRQMRLKALQAAPEYAEADDAARFDAEAAIDRAYEAELDRLDRTFGRVNVQSKQE